MRIFSSLKVTSLRPAWPMAGKLPPTYHLLSSRKGKLVKQEKAKLAEVWVLPFILPCFRYSELSLMFIIPLVLFACTSTEKARLDILDRPTQWEDFVVRLLWTTCSVSFLSNLQSPIRIAVKGHVCISVK